MAIIFDGVAVAQTKEQQLMQRVATLREQGQHLTIAAILFSEDQGSQLYTQLKHEAAARVGIEYRVSTFSMRDNEALITQRVQELSRDASITGIIIQKPWRQTWIDTTGGNAEEFQQWWHTLTVAIDPMKDVDGLHPETLTAIQTGNWQDKGKVLPATCQAVLYTLEQAMEQTKKTLSNSKVIILGKSDLLGQPLFYELKNRQVDVEMIGSQELSDRIEQGRALTDADVIVSATGRHHLITGEMVKNQSILIDVGEPRPDVDFDSVLSKAAFITPVPGGIGPMTVVCLLENCVMLVTKSTFHQVQ